MQAKSTAEQSENAPWSAKQKLQMVWSQLEG